MTTAREIIDFLDADGRLEWVQPPDPLMTIDGPAPIDRGEPGSISFLAAASSDPAGLLRTGRPSVVVVDREVPLGAAALRDSSVRLLIRSDNARLDFMRVVAEFFAPPPERVIHPSAVVSATAVVGENVAIGPLCTVGDGCHIGAGSVLEAGVHLYPGVILGERVHVHAGAVLGADGFGYERAPDGTLVKFPHLGNVEVGDDVEIGANTCIDRGTLGATVIARGAKIDNLVHIGHNVQVGEHAVVIALAMIGGSTDIGARAWISPSACLRDNISIGTDAVVGLAAVVTKDVPAGTTVVGAPARTIAEHRRLLDAWNATAAEGAP